MNSYPVARGDVLLEMNAATREKGVPLLERQAWLRELRQIDINNALVTSLCVQSSRDVRLWILDHLKPGMNARSIRPWCSLAEHNGRLALVHIVGRFTGGNREFDYAEFESIARL